MLGADLQTQTPLHHATTLLATPDQPHLCQRSYVHSQWQHTHCHPHFLGTCSKLRRRKGPRRKPHGSLPTRTEPSPDQEGCHKQCPDPDSWLNHRQETLFTLLFQDNHRQANPVISLLGCPGPSLQQDLLEVPIGPWESHPSTPRAQLSEPLHFHITSDGSGT